MIAFAPSLALPRARGVTSVSIRRFNRVSAVLSPASKLRLLPPLPANHVKQCASLTRSESVDSGKSSSVVPRKSSSIVAGALLQRLALWSTWSKHFRERHARGLRYARLAVGAVFALVAVYALRNPGALANSGTLQATSGGSAGVALPSSGMLRLPESVAATLRPFTESFTMVFTSEFGDKSMFATALMAMKHSPILVLIGALVALTLMTLIACFLGQLMKVLPATVTHYSTIALFVFFGAQMLLQARSLPSVPGGVGGERADAETMVAGMTVAKQSPLSVLAKISSLIFVAEWCDRSMIATMALAASNNSLVVVGGATAANVLCTCMAVGSAALVASRISERTVAIVAGVLFEIFAVVTFFEGPES